MGWLDGIRQGFDDRCLVDSLERDACAVCVAGLPEPRLLVDLDLPGSPLGPQAVRCDYLVFAGDPLRTFVLAAVEFKSRWRPKVVEQLQAGATEADRHARGGLSIRFRPVVALRRCGRPDRRSLRERVNFRGRNEPIRVVLCGEPLAKVLTE